MANTVEDFLIKKVKALGYNAASTLMSSLYPRDFEAYMIAFELCDSQGKELDYMTFPVMPNELNIDETLPVKVQSTFGGVSTVSANIYNPKNISFSGSFGRNFKVISRSSNAAGLLKDSIALNSLNKVDRTYGVNSVIPKMEVELSKVFKTGYGCCKVFQSIINRTYDVDKNGQTNKLYFYNMALGESYLVKPITFRLNQSIQNNAIWEYNLQLQTICPIYLEKSNILSKSLTSAVTSSVNALINSLR